MFRRKYKDRVPVIRIEGVEVSVGRSIKYLGLIVDDYWNFKLHVKAAVEKAERVLGTLSRLMPNIGGPKEPRRKLLMSVVYSVMLYGCPVWGHTLAYAKSSVDALMRVQRRAALRSSCAYRTVSYPTTGLIAATPPIDLLVQERKTAYDERRLENEAVRSGAGRQFQKYREEMMEEWKRRLENTEKGEWTRALIRDVGGWCNRKHGHLSYHLVQLLSGHGCFGTYLARIKKETSPRCHHCLALEDGPEHTLLDCPSWEKERRDMHGVLNGVQADSMVEKMVRSPECWKAVEKYASEVMKKKEEAERLRRPN